MKVLDCKYVCLSQMLQRAHVQKAQGQYCSNVAMKVNAKLGGQVGLPTSSRNTLETPCPGLCPPL